MLSLDELLHPITPDRFMTDYYGRKPLHIPAHDGAPKRTILNWARFNALLSQTSIWNPGNLRMVRDSEPIGPEEYCVNVVTGSGPALRPSPAKVEVMLSIGASLIANEIELLTPEMSDLADMLGRVFAAKASANAYCSFGGVRAFATHFDLHDVFAIHTQGEKTWRLYENRADRPVDPPGDGVDPRAWFAQTRGPLLQEVRMRAGDVLYLPRGCYHDALADGPLEDGSASLHVTFSVTPLYGRIVFDLLENAAMQDPAFRSWLPPAHVDDGEALRLHLADLGRRLSALTALPAFRDEISRAQQRLIPRPATYDLPDRKPVTLYRPTGLRGPVIVGPAAVAMDWVFSQPQFALEDLCARFDFVAEPDLRAAVLLAEKGGALARL